MAGVYDMASGFDDRDALTELKTAKLRAQIARIHADSPFHRERLEAAGVGPDDIRTLDDLSRLPFMDKIQERESQARSQELGLSALGMHIVCDPREVIRVSSTSGTTGTPTFTGYTAADTAVTTEVFRRAMPMMGAEPGDVAMHAFVLSMWIAGVPVAAVMEDAGLTVVPIGGTSGAERFAVTAQATRPVQLSCTPSYAAWMAGVLRDEAGIDAGSLGIKRLILAGEPGGSIPEVRERLSSLWGGAQIYDGIGALHSSFFSSFNCDANAGLHFLAEDFVHMEIVDPATGESLPLEDGVSGEGVFTALQKECAPALRFRSGDRFVIRRGRCECGRDTLRYAIDGRVDDMLLVRGVNVFPAAIGAVVARFADRGVSSTMRIVLKQEPPVQEPPLPVRVELDRELSGEERSSLAAEISALVSQELRFKCAIELLDPGSLAAFDQGKNQKQQVFEREYES